MHPLTRNVVISLVGLIIAGALAALAVLGTDTQLSVLALLAASLIAAGIGLFLYAQGWRWGSRLARRRSTGRSVLVAVAGGLMAILAAAALAGLVIIALLFYLG